MPYRRVGRQRAGPARRSRSGCGTTSATTCRWSASRPSCDGPSTGASRTSTSRTTTARPTAAPSATSARSSPATSPLPRRADHLSKAGYDMWPGPYGQGGGSRKYVIASCEQSLGAWVSTTSTSSTATASTRPLRSRRRWARWTALVRQGKALYAGISSYSGARTREAVEILRELGTPLLIHQPSYSMLNRWIEDRWPARRARGDTGVGCIAFSPLAQGMLTNKYLTGIPADSRAAQGKSLDPALLSEDTLKHIRALTRDRQEARPVAWPRWRWPGCCVTRGSPRPSSAPPASRNSTTASPRWTTWSSRPRTCKPSTGMRSSPESTCGPDRRRSSREGIRDRGTA
jgi:hypothetical protein